MDANVQQTISVLCLQSRKLWVAVRHHLHGAEGCCAGRTKGGSAFFRRMEKKSRLKDNRYALQQTITFEALRSIHQLSSSMALKRSDFHLGESQRVVGALPDNPLHAVTVRRMVASQIAAVKVGGMTCIVPPGTFEHHGT